jgi:hypothetical protein
MIDDTPENFGEGLDQRVEILVYTISSLPGIETYASCGGHKKQTHPTQCKEDEFWVGFVVDPSERGLLSLGLIAQAAQRVDEKNISVNVYAMDDNPRELVFSVDGKNEASPFKLAKTIRDLSSSIEKE